MSYVSVRACTRAFVLGLGSLALLFAAPLAFAQATPAASPEIRPWNQEVVTATAGELEDAVAGLRDALRKSRQWDVPTQKRPLYELAEKLRLIEFSAQSLHAELKNGAGMEESKPTFDRLESLRRQAQTVSARIEISETIRPQLTKAQELLAKIEPYYGQPAVGAEP